MSWEISLDIRRKRKDISRTRKQYRTAARINSSAEGCRTQAPQRLESAGRRRELVRPRGSSPFSHLSARTRSCALRCHTPLARLQPRQWGRWAHVLPPVRTSTSKAWRRGSSAWVMCSPWKARQPCWKSRALAGRATSGTKCTIWQRTRTVASRAMCGTSH